MQRYLAFHSTSPVGARAGRYSPAVRLADVDSLADPRLAPFRNLPDRQLRAAGELFLVEGRLGVRRLLTESNFAPHSFFLTPPADSLNVATASGIALHTFARVAAT